MHQLHILIHDASLIFWFRGLPILQAALDFIIAEINREQISLSVNRDHIAILYRSNRATKLSLRANVANNHAMSAAGEAPISDQADRFAIALTNQSRGDSQHFAHTRAAFRAFIANHHSIAIFDFMLHDSLKSLFFRVKDPGRATMAGRLQSSNLTYS